MKGKVMKILMVTMIILSLGLVATAVKLISMDREIERLNEYIVENEIEDVEKPITNPIIEPEPPIIEENPETPDIDENPDMPEENVNKDPDKGSEDEVVKLEKPDDKDNNDDKANNQDKPEKKDNNNKPEKKDNNNKPEKKDKPNKPDKKDNPNKGQKPDKNKPSIVKPKLISESEAIKIGLEKVGDGAKLIEVDADLDDNPPKYELEIICGDYEYELEIHGITGAILDFEKDEL